MCLKNLSSLLFLFLCGCSSVDNIVGFGVSFDRVISRECVTTTLSTAQDVVEFIEDKSSVRFVSQKYKVDFNYGTKESLISGYEITIDGMFLGQSNATFIQNSYGLQKRLHSLIEQGCY